jgi:hypothetical protein
MEHLRMIDDKFLIGGKASVAREFVKRRQL